MNKIKINCWRRLLTERETSFPRTTLNHYIDHQSKITTLIIVSIPYHYLSGILIYDTQTSVIVYIIND